MLEFSLLKKEQIIWKQYYMWYLKRNFLLFPFLYTFRQIHKKCPFGKLLTSVIIWFSRTLGSCLSGKKNHNAFHFLSWYTSQMYWTTTVCKDLGGGNPGRRLESKERIINKKAMKMVLSGGTQGSVSHCPTDDRVTGKALMGGPCHIAAILVAPKIEKHTHCTLHHRNVRDLQK